MNLLFNKYGFGVPISNEYEYSSAKIKETVDKYLMENFDESFKTASIQELPENYLEYCWTPWLEYNEKSFDRIQFRRDLYTPYTLTSRDIEEYDGDEELLPYNQVYFRSFPIKYIMKMCKKHLNGFFNKKCLVLGCGTGECLLMLESYGIHSIGIESAKYAIENVNPLASRVVKFGDPIADIYNIPDKSFDLVFTNLLNWVDRRDIVPVLTEINRISRICILQHSYDGNSYKLKSKKWWQKQFNKAGMSYSPASIRITVCN